MHISEYCQVTASGGKETSWIGTWGGHQNRLVRTKNGDLYLAYITDTGEGDKVPEKIGYSLYKKEGTRWKTIFDGFFKGQCLHLLKDSQDNLYCILGHDPNFEGLGESFPVIHKYSPENGNITKLECYDAWKHGYNYCGATISRTDKIFFTAQKGIGSDNTGFAWNEYDVKTGKWGVMCETPTDYRYAYPMPYYLNDGSVNLVMVRDVLYEHLGCEKPKCSHTSHHNYLFNKLSLWKIDHPRIPEAKLTVIHEEPYTSGSEPTTAIVACNGDAFVDNNNNFHIIFWAVGPSTSVNGAVVYKILQNGKIKETVIWETERCSCKFVHDSIGNLYLLKIPYESTMLSVYKLNNADRLFDKEPVFTYDLPGEPLSYSGMSVTSLRGGTQDEDYVDCIYPDSGRKKWTYFRLYL